MKIREIANFIYHFIEMKHLILFGCLLAIFAACEYKKGMLPKPQPVPAVNSCDTVKYSLHIQPILTANCTGIGCHTTGFLKGDFTNYNGTKVKYDDGTFVGRVLVAKDMPSGPPLSSLQLQTLQCWVDMGAPNN